MNRTVAVVTLTVMSVVGFTPRAEAVGGAVCIIEGVLTLSPPSPESGEGTWTIGPANIECKGVYYGSNRMLGPGPFKGSGTYQAVTPGDDTCWSHVGTGEVDYLLYTREADVRVIEQHDFTLAGIGTFTTPTLRGGYELSPYEGDCLESQVTKARITTQALIVRDTRIAS